MAQAENQHNAPEVGLVTDYLLHILDHPYAGVKRMVLQDSAGHPDLTTVHKAVALDPTQLDPFKAAASRRYQSHSELLAIAHTPDNRLYGILATSAAVHDQGEQTGIVVSEFAAEEDEQAVAVGEARHADHDLIAIRAQGDRRLRDGSHSWELGVGLCEDGGVTQIALIHSGIGATALYRADSAADVSFAENVPLSPHIWCPPTPELVDVLYEQ